MSDYAMTVSEVARALSVERSVIYRLVRSGDLPAIRVGNRLRIRREVVEMLVRAKAS